MPGAAREARAMLWAFDLERRQQAGARTAKVHPIGLAARWSLVKPAQLALYGVTSRDLVFHPNRGHVANPIAPQFTPAVPNAVCRFCFACHQPA